MEPEGSLSLWKERSTESYFEPHESNPRRHALP